MISNILWHDFTTVDSSTIFWKVPFIVWTRFSEVGNGPPENLKSVSVAVGYCIETMLFQQSKLWEFWARRRAEEALRSISIDPAVPKKISRFATCNRVNILRFRKRWTEGIDKNMERSRRSVPLLEKSRRSAPVEQFLEHWLNRQATRGAYLGCDDGRKTPRKSRPCCAQTGTETGEWATPCLKPSPLSPLPMCPLPSVYITIYVKILCASIIYVYTYCILLRYLTTRLPTRMLLSMPHADDEL